MVRLVRTVAPLVAVVSLVLGLTGCTPPTSYVALGDSYTSGPLVLPQRDDPRGCFRSERNYPSVAAPSIAVDEFRDPSCSGARTTHMTAPQDVELDGPNAPQFDALDASTSVVSVGIGGNDIGFSEIATTCGQKGPSDPTGSPCKAFYSAGGQDQVAARIAALGPKVRAVLDGIEARSPNAKVFVVGYPAILPEQLTMATWAACFSSLPVAFGDMAWLRDDVEKRLNATIRAEAVAAGATYVDTYAASIGHDACKPPTVRWVEPVVPGSPAFPVHPNALGMRASGEALLAAMRAAGVPMR
jgi:hypothetical protein